MICSFDTSEEIQAKSVDRDGHQNQAIGKNIGLGKSNVKKPPGENAGGKGNSRQTKVFKKRAHGSCFHLTVMYSVVVVRDSVGILSMTAKK